MYSIVGFMRGRSKYSKDEGIAESNGSSVVEDSSEMDAFSGPNSYYANRNMFYTLSPRDVSQSKDMPKEM